MLEVDYHLADTDANIAHRLKRVLSEERLVFERVKPDLMPAAPAYHDRDVEEELAYVDWGRRRIARILRASPPGAWERIGVNTDAHSGGGPGEEAASLSGSPGERHETNEHSGGTWVPPEKLSRCPRSL